MVAPRPPPKTPRSQGGERTAGTHKVGKGTPATEWVPPDSRLPIPAGRRRRQGRRVGPWQTPRPTSGEHGGSSGDSALSRSPSGLSSERQAFVPGVRPLHAARSAAIPALIFTVSTARSTGRDQRLPLLGIVVRVHHIRPLPAHLEQKVPVLLAHTSSLRMVRQGVPGDGLIVQVLRWISATSRSVSASSGCLPK